MTEIRYVEGLYRMWDELRAAYPRLAIDNCFGGGRRIDLETSSRSLPLWRTDATYRTDPDGKARTGGRPESDDDRRTEPLRTLQHLRPDRRDAVHVPQRVQRRHRFQRRLPAGRLPQGPLEKAIAEGKRIRKYYFGDFYPLVPVTAGAGDWCVLQYHLPAEEEGMILAFRRHESPAAEMELSVRSIDPEGEYDVTLARGFERTRRRSASRVESCGGCGR